MTKFLLLSFNLIRTALLNTTEITKTKITKAVFIITVLENLKPFFMYLKNQ